MRQLFLQGMATMLAIFPLWGEGIDTTQAARIAANHLGQQQALRAVPQLTLAYTVQSPLRSTNPDYYAFNIGDNQGYILIAGDDQAAPVLGWTTEGQFQADSLPDNLKAHLRLFQEEIAAGRRQTTSAPVTLNTKAVESEIVLRTAPWGQDGPYNLYTPTLNNTQTPTGCLATAAGIIMRYHQYPTKAVNGVSSYYGQSITYDTLQWKWMPNMLPFFANSQQAVSTLLWQIGANSNLHYTTRETSGRLDSVLVALKHNFSYSEEARLLLEQAYTTQQWDKLIHQEIDADRPVLYSGQALLNEVQYGHAFVIDGYQGDAYYHVNWGWDGRNNGFFRLHALETNGLNYDREQAMIIGIRPPEPTDKPVTELCYTEWQIESVNSQSYQTELKIFNAGSRPFTGEIALAQVTPNGEIKEIVTDTQYLEQFQQGISILSCSATVAINEPLQTGWSIRPVYKAQQGQWRLMTQGQGQPWGIVAEGIANEPISGTNSQSIETDGTQVICSPYCLTIRPDRSAPYRLYNLRGQCIRSGQVPQGGIQIELPKGNYILTIGDKPYKVII